MHNREDKQNNVGLDSVTKSGLTETNPVYFEDMRISRSGMISYQAVATIKG